MSSCMAQGRDFYRLYDPDPTLGCYALGGPVEADKWAAEKWGIFWTVNQFDGPRKKENLKKILAWTVDIDLGSKNEQRELIKRYVTPSAIIETKRGYQLYFDAIDGTAENYDDIQSRLVLAYNGDAKARDICRILRVPTYLHWKDPNDPFAIKLVHSTSKQFTEAKMKHFFPSFVPEVVSDKIKTQMREEMKFTNDQGLFDRIYAMDCEYALIKLSGTPAVAFETYAFRPASRGHKNIIVNGKGTSCFIDGAKRIGSMDKGGPTIWQWLYWYQKDHSAVYRTIKEVFPEVANVGI